MLTMIGLMLSLAINLLLYLWLKRQEAALKNLTLVGKIHNAVMKSILGQLPNGDQIPLVP